MVSIKQITLQNKYICKSLSELHLSAVCGTSEFEGEVGEENQICPQKDSADDVVLGDV